MNQTWSYDQTDTPPDPDWNQAAYDDGHWPQGPALLYVESSGLPGPKQTQLVLGADAYYFRTQFQANITGNVDALGIQTIIDDGAIIYLNGAEVLRLNLPGGPVDHFTRTSSSVGNAPLEGPFEIPASLLRPGTNTLAAEVHQSSGGSSDIVFGLQLEAITRTRLEQPIE